MSENLTTPRATAGWRRSLPLLFALYACWGTAIPAMKLMVAAIPPMSGAALIFLLGGTILAMAARDRPRPNARQLGKLALAGVLLLVGGQGLAMIALTEVTASLGAILVAAIPLWVVVLGALIGTPTALASLVRLAAGFAGIGLVILTAPGSAIGGAPWAVAIFFIAPVLWASGSLVTAHVQQPIDARVAAAVQLLAGGAALLLIALMTGDFHDLLSANITPQSLGAALYLVIFDSLLGFLLYTHLLKTAPTALVSTYAYITPIVGAAVGVVVLNEPLWAGAFLGGALVIGAVALELRDGARS